MGAGHYDSPRSIVTIRVMGEGNMKERMIEIGIAIMPYIKFTRLNIPIMTMRRRETIIHLTFFSVLFFVTSHDNDPDTLTVAVPVCS